MVALEWIVVFCFGIVAACFSVQLIVATAAIVWETILDARKEHSRPRAPLRSNR